MNAAVAGLEAVLAEDPDGGVAAVAWVAGEAVAFDEELLRGARRRAVLLLAAGGDPTRDLEPDGRAVGSLAADLDTPERRSQLAAGLVRLRAQAADAPAVVAAVDAVLAD